MLKKGAYVKFKNYERKTRSPFMVYVDSESILGAEDNGKAKSGRLLYEQISKTCCLQLWLQISM